MWRIKLLIIGAACLAVLVANFVTRPIRWIWRWAWEYGPDEI